MNTTATLPAQLNGSWIWIEEHNIHEESHQFFRRDFVLDELPGSSDIWISARTAFHLFVNGRHCAAGPVPHPLADHCYVCHFSADFLLQLGVNQIAIQAFNPNAPLSNCHSAPGGVWMQLDLDAEPFLWTDENWMCLQPRGYSNPGIYQCIGGVNVEFVDFRAHPNGWVKKPFLPPLRKGTQERVFPPQHTPNGFAWQAPNRVIPVQEAPVKMDLSPSSDDLLEYLGWQHLTDTGHFAPRLQSLWVNFRRLTATAGPGVYLAECFLYSKDSQWQDINCHCNRPYRLYLNDGLLIEQAPPPPPVHADPRPRGDIPLALNEYAESATTMRLLPGWNRLFLVLDCASCGHGLTITFANCPAGKLPVHTIAKTSSPEGWAIAGPLRAPFSMVSPDLPMRDLLKHEFILKDNPPWDMAALQHSLSYHPDPMPITPEGNPPPAALLQNAQYAIFDFGQTIYGFPVVISHGSKNNILNIICGDHLQDNRVVAYTGVRRTLASVTLDGNTNQWIATVPQGFRYLMVQAQHTATAITIESVHARVFVRSQNRHGKFQCADKVLNRIWDTGVATLESTVHGQFLDSPCGDQTQYIADAMIQSWAAFHTFGDYAVSAQALRDFAATQLETGEFNSGSPSGLFQALPDYSLLWIIWLHRHYNYTGDQELLKELFPHAEELLNYYNSLAIAPDGPIGDLQNRTGTLPFLDHDDAIERNGVSTGLNAIYTRALFCTAALAACLGDSTKEQLYQNRAATVTAYIRSLAWNEERGLFADAYVDQQQSETCSWQTNVLAFFGAFVEEDHFDQLWQQLFQDNPPAIRNPAPQAENPYFNYFVLEVALALGKTAWAFGFLKTYWGAMLKAGATTWWELFSPAVTDDPRLVSHCHGYGVSPNGFLISDLIGLRPAEPGMQRIFFAPALIPTVAWAKADVPTPHGIIHLAWQNSATSGIEISIDANYPLEVIPVLPQDKADREVTFNAGDQVTVLAPEEEETEDEEPPAESPEP